MLKMVIASVVAVSLTTIPAYAMCCGGKDAAGSKEAAAMQCMNMDMPKADAAGANQTPKSGDPHAGMDMESGKDSAMDHSSKSCCCCDKKSS
ncbi:MAG: hypothetical protein NW216_12030 [Hyphomicrobium sp.]|nr:hypothetical protein [Hyphomicrobium sp.]